MCGRYTLVADPHAIELKFGITLPSAEATKRYNVCPTEPVLALRRREPDGPVFPEVLQWGLVPSWSKDAKGAARMINARDDKLLERSAFKDLLPRVERRCLVLADGFYEWQKPEDPKGKRRPMRFTVDDGEPFAFAGLCASWYPDEGEPLHTCTIITTTPNALVAPVHDRMPAILADEETRAAWLSPLEPEELIDLIGPLDNGRMTATPVNARVNKAGYDEADVLDPPDD
jgi:putative SOS response-associated peptidase YedK